MIEDVLAEYLGAAHDSASRRVDKARRLRLASPQTRVNPELEETSA
jgi:hypothetical protein